MKNREGVCYGRPQHIAQFCIANMPDDVKRRILDHSTHIATIEPDDCNNNGLFAFTAQQHIKSDMPVPLSTAFSELALTELRLNSINADTATTNVTRSADCVAATHKKRKKKKGGGVHILIFFFMLLLFFLSLLFHIHLISFIHGGVGTQGVC